MSARHHIPVLCLLLSIAGCKESVPDTIEASRDVPGWAQCQSSNSKDNPCQVSIYSLVTTPSAYNGMYVEFIGYFPSKGARLIFANSDAAESSDYLSSLLMESSPESDAGYFKVNSLFSHDFKDSGLATGVYRQQGRLQDVKLSQVQASIKALSEKCERTPCEAYYINGVLPAIRNKSP